MRCQYGKLGSRTLLNHKFEAVAPCNKFWAVAPINHYNDEAKGDKSWAFAPLMAAGCAGNNISGQSHPLNTNQLNMPTWQQLSTAQGKA